MDNSRKVSIENSVVSGSMVSAGDIKDASITIGSDKLDDLFQRLNEVIDKECSDQEKNKALEASAKVKESLAKGDISSAKKFFDWLPTVVQATAVGVEILKLML